MTFKTNIGNVKLDHNIVKGLYWNEVKKKKCCIICNKILLIEQDKGYMTCTNKQCNVLH